MNKVSFQLHNTGVVVLKQFNTKSLGYLYIVIAAVIWGSNGVIVNRVPYDAYTIAFFRVLFASLIFMPVVLFTRKAETVRAARSWKLMLCLGLLLALGWALLFYSMKLIAIANAVLLNYTAPIFVALLAPLLLKERLEKTTLLALAISIAGIAVISYQQNLQLTDFNYWGVILGLLAGLAYAGFVIVSKKALSSYSTYVVAFYAYSIAAIFLLPFVIGANLTADFMPWVLLLIMGIFNTTFAVTLYLKGLGLVKSQKAVIITYLEPVSAMVFGLIFLSQQPTLFMIFGGLLIVLSGYIVASR